MTYYLRYFMLDNRQPTHLTLSLFVVVVAATKLAS